MIRMKNDAAIVTAGTKDKFNSLSVGYGAEGVIWGKDVYYVFVKPERYTYEFLKSNDYFVVSYFPKEFKSIHKIYGMKSGRETDKEKETGLIPKFLENGISFEQAEEYFVCKKMYMAQLDKDSMRQDIRAKYEDPNTGVYGETHYMIIGEIVEHIKK